MKHRDNFSVYSLRKNVNNWNSDIMSPMDFMVFTLLGLLALVGANAVLWLVTKRAEHVKKIETQVLVFSVIIYIIYLFFLVLFYSYGTPIA